MGGVAQKERGGILKGGHRNIFRGPSSLEWCAEGMDQIWGGSHLFPVLRHWRVLFY